MTRYCSLPALYNRDSRSLVHTDTACEIVSTPPPPPNLTPPAFMCAEYGTRFSYSNGNGLNNGRTDDVQKGANDPIVLEPSALDSEQRLDRAPSGTPSSADPVIWETSSGETRSEGRSTEDEPAAAPASPDPVGGEPSESCTRSAGWAIESASSGDPVFREASASETRSAGEQQPIGDAPPPGTPCSRGSTTGETSKSETNVKGHPVADAASGTDAFVREPPISETWPEGRCTDDPVASGPSASPMTEAEGQHAEHHAPPGADTVLLESSTSDSRRSEGQPVEGASSGTLSSGDPVIWEETSASGTESRASASLSNNGAAAAAAGTASAGEPSDMQTEALWFLDSLEIGRDPLGDVP